MEYHEQLYADESDNSEIDWRGKSKTIFGGDIMYIENLRSCYS